MSDGFSITRRVQFAETDLAGVLHFANYFRYMEEVEHAFWRSIGRSVITTEGEQVMSWPRAAVACDYFAPARFEDELTLHFRVTHVGNRSVGYEIEFTRAGAPLALGKVTAVCCGMKDGTFSAMEIPDSVRSKLAAAQTAPRA